MPTHYSEAFHIPPNGVVDAIISAYGIEFMRRVATAFGGQEIKFPRKQATLKDEHRVVRALGREDALKLSALFSGECISIPKGYRRKPHPFAALLIEEASNGRPAHEIADRLGVTMRQVRRLKQELGLKNKAGSRSREQAQIWLKRNAIIKAHVQGQVDRKTAMSQLSLSGPYFLDLVSRFLEEGSVFPAWLDVADFAFPPQADSNAGLTGLANISAPTAHPAPKTRASGL